MDKIKRLSTDEFKDIASQKPFKEQTLAKDFFVTALLYLLKNSPGIYFKGGTALQKIFLDYSRLSEDIDYTVSADIEETKKRIIDTVQKSKLFDRVTLDKDVEGFTRILAHYKDFSGKDDVVFIDLSKKAELSLPPEVHEIIHFYPEFIPKFSIKTVAQEEMIAEKMAAAIGRNKPRDHFDLYMIIKAGKHINLELVNKKCQQSDCEFSIIKMFNKAKKLKKRWDSDTSALLSEEVSFVKVMITLSKHFKLKEEKESLKESKQK